MSTEIKYPFEFKELLLTDKVLDVLGFSEYWAGSGEFGERTFGKLISDYQYEHWYRIVEEDELDDSSFGYSTPEYSSRHYHSPFSSKKHRTIYFLHDLYEDIKENSPEVLEMFVEKTKEKGVNMYPYIKSWLEYKTKNHNPSSMRADKVTVITVSGFYKPKKWEVLKIATSQKWNIVTDIQKDELGFTLTTTSINLSRWKWIRNFQIRMLNKIFKYSN